MTARGASDRAVIVALGFAGLTVSMVQSVLLPIQGELPRLMATERSVAGWAITATLLASLIAAPITGRLGDMFGRRRILLALLVLQVAGSVICFASALVPPAAIAPLVLTGRVLQGLGLGVIPLGIAVLRDAVSPARLPSAIAFVSATLGVGAAVGLPVSAALTQFFDWRALFALTAALGVGAFVLVARAVPSLDGVGGRIDYLGALGLAVGVSAVILAISQGGVWGWGSAATLSLLAGGLVVLVVWCVYQLRVRDPLVDIRSSARPAVLLTNLASVGMGFALFASSIAFPQYLTQSATAGGAGLTLLQAGIAQMPGGIAMLLTAPVAGRWQLRFGPRSLLAVGAAVVAACYLTAALAPLSVPLVVVLSTLIGVGVGWTFAAMPSLIMRAVPRSETAAANGLNTLMRSFGTTLASAVIAAALLALSADVDGRPVPTEAAYSGAFLLGTAAALACVVITLFIPRATQSAPADSTPILKEAPAK